MNDTVVNGSTLGSSPLEQHSQQVGFVTPAEGIHDPPRSALSTLRWLGPGLIVAGSIVGSGELIATTSVGAEAGFTLLWLIVIGCAIKVFVQIELGRYTMTQGETTLEALNRLPGPRMEWTSSLRDRPVGGNWVLWAWVVMTLLVLTQQGGIVGGVGQALAMQFPLTARGQEWNRQQNERLAAQVALAARTREQAMFSRGGKPIDGQAASPPSARERVGQTAAPAHVDEPLDAHLWATITAVITAALMAVGRYGLIQVVSTGLVAIFTLLTMVTVVQLQRQPVWAVTWENVWQGCTFQLPPKTEESDPLATALATFGLIGVGAGELLMYPYWCLEKGYARFTGPRQETAAWRDRADGWLRVLRWDAWGSMAIYTTATVAFYLLGAAVLWRVGLQPARSDMVRTLAQMYVPVFGPSARILFLVGAAAVLYSTYFVVSAGFARLVADGFCVMGMADPSDDARRRMTRTIGVLWPLLAVALFWWFQAPRQMVLASGVAQAMMLPVLGFAALYFRYRRSEMSRTRSAGWDAGLWLSFAGFLLVAAATVWTSWR